MQTELRFCYWGQVPSKSNYRHNRTKASRKAWSRIKYFEEELAVLARQAWIKQTGTGTIAMLKLPHPITVTILPYNQRIDANNITKGAIDALIGLCYEDDKRVGANVRPMETDKKGGRIYVRVQWG